MTTNLPEFMQEQKRLIADCSTYKFGMLNADRLAHVEAPKLIAEADVWLKTMNSQHSDSLVRDLRDALAAPLDPEKVAEVLDGNHFIEHGPGYGEHLALTPEACRHFARAICEAAKRGELT